MVPLEYGLEFSTDAPGPDSWLFGEANLAFCPSGIDMVAPWDNVGLSAIIECECYAPSISAEPSLASFYDGSDNNLDSAWASKPSGWRK